MPVVAVDVAPESGKVATVVRADNKAYGTKAYGTKACAAIGEKVKQGKVVQIMGDLASVNGRERSPPTRTSRPSTCRQAGCTWRRRSRRCGARTCSSRSAIPSTWCWSATTESRRSSKPSGRVSSTPRCPSLPMTTPSSGCTGSRRRWRGRPSNLDRPTTTARSWKTRPGILEDQLPAPVVTKANVDDKALWGNNL